jgi:hypothetical protein
MTTYPERRFEIRIRIVIHTRAESAELLAPMLALPTDNCRYIGAVAPKMSLTNWIEQTDLMGSES